VHLRSGSRTWMWLLVAGLIFTQAVPRLAAQKDNERQPTIIVFDLPGAGTGPYQGTQPGSINEEGAITGTYSDVNGAFHGFLRAPDGTFTTLDAPGAGTGLFQGTDARRINAAGVITGEYIDVNGTSQGFLRAPDGTFTTFEVPGADFTEVGNINPAGVIAGNYIVRTGPITLAEHGFLRASDGTITTFDAPGTRTRPALSTYVADINPAGVIAGIYDAAGEPGATTIMSHGYLRAPDGTITMFDAPNATGYYGNTYAEAINAAGVITGDYDDANGVSHGFLRAPDGTITSFDAPGAGSGISQGTVVTAINSAGVITGYIFDSKTNFHGFLRAQDGAFTTVDVPPPGGVATFPMSINPAGTITGSYMDNAFVYHGFVRYEGSQARSR
jgi:hypothetical protein